jgi:hypothetical protein
MQDPNHPETTADVAERMTSRISNSMVIAAGVLALGIYWSGDEVETPTYQAVSTPDGRVVRVNTESGSIVSCDAARCTLIYLDGERLDRVREGGEAEAAGVRPPEGAQPALPQPKEAPQPAPAPKAPPADSPPPAQAAPQPQR